MNQLEMTNSTRGDDMPLDKHVQAFLTTLEQAGAPRYGEQPIDEQRQAMQASAGTFFGSFEQVPFEDQVVPSKGAPVPIRVYRPVERPAPIMIYLHGGGWVLGNLETAHRVCATLARLSSCIVVSIDYRLAPEHPFPAALEDAWTVTEWLSQRAETIGGQPDALAIGGDSAGGNISAVIARRARDASLKLGLQLLVYPVCDADLTTSSYTEFADGYWLTRDAMQWFWEQYLPGGDWFQADASPLRARDVTSVAPAHVITAEYDVLRDEGEAYGRRLEEAGVPTVIRRHDGMIHGFFRLPAVVPRANDALAEAAEAVRRAFQL
jgi:acetyl esterase